MLVSEWNMETAIEVRGEHAWGVGLAAYRVFQTSLYELGSATVS